VTMGYAKGGKASTKNRSIEFNAKDGTISATGQIRGSASRLDIAEYFENLTSGAIPLGTIVSLEGDKIRPARADDHILGVISATASIISGAQDFYWQGRYLTGEFGEPLFDAAGERIENPDYDPERDYIPRSQRPDAWSSVGLVGQLHTRVASELAVGDYVRGDGRRSGVPSRLRVMKLQPTKLQNQAIAICLLV
ncbi:MAG: peptidase G2 autoproteolytic cleavage domain-containing protein, partial [Pseudomonadota bacterium]